MARVHSRFNQGRGVTPGLALGFIALVLVLAVSVVVALTTARTVHRAGSAVAHTNDVKAQLHALLASLIDAETGERGYIITGNESYLEPYTRGVTATAAEIARVRQLTADNPEQQSDLDRVAADARVRLDELAKGIQARREQGFDAAQAVVLTNLGKRTMDGIRGVVARMEAREDALLASRTADARRAYDTDRVTTLTMGGVGLLVVAALFVVTRKVGIERKAAVNLAEQLEATVHARDEFLSIAAHELRNPVNAVQLQLLGILRAFRRGATGSGELSPEVLRERVGQAHTQVTRLTRLLDNLLDVSQMRDASFALEVEDVDLKEVVDNVVEQFRGEARSGQVTFDAPRPVVGRWDRLRLEQVVSNLLSNAIKYGEGRPILLSLQGDDRTARFSVQDHGIGLTPEQQERLFTRFERGVSRQQYGGFGLGLWITRQLVDAMGGEISVASDAGQGATFSIVLPIDREAITGTRKA